jgi:hypothetical protein
LTNSNSILLPTPKYTEQGLSGLPTPQPTITPTPTTPAPTTPAPTKLLPLTPAPTTTPAVIPTTTPTITPTTKLGPNYTVIQDNIDYPGNDIEYKLIPYNECQNACSTTTGCVGYVINKEAGKNCWLKSSLQGKTTNTQRTTFSPKYTFHDNVDYPGNDIAYKLIPYSECENACNTTPGCAGYVIDKEAGKNCWLKSSFQGQTKNTQRATYINCNIL